MSHTPAPTADTAISLAGITKTFGPMTAVDAMDLAVPRGALYGFIGPNGAGKTTTIRMIMSILFPDSGELHVLGRRSALDAKDRIGYLPEERGVYRKMRVGDFLAFVARLKGLRGPGVPKRVRQGLERVGLGGVERKRCEELSKGMLQKAQFVASILHEPDLIILDEPFSGLDPVSMRLLKEQIAAEHRRGATVLFSTHVMPQAEEMCDHVIMVHRGRKVLDASVDAIRRRFDTRTIQLEPLDADADVSGLTALAGIERVERAERGYDIALTEDTEPADAMRRIVQQIAPARIELSRPRLEDVFIEIVTADAESRAAPDRVRTGAALRDAITGASAGEAAS
ncbi:MAG: ATP-binding cassette domain-containing protein [Gammaproteobacteria bacterium]|nr:ATP-binding cassette domain-containing protein [Gammaproteobacteria bacterium]